MGFLKLVPLVMVDIPVSIQIGRLEHFRCGLGEMSLEFSPVDQIISVQIHIGKMRIEALWVR